MRFVAEIVVEEFLPTFRSMLAGELHDRGHTQREIADFLGVSQSAVSKYIHGSVATNERIASDDRVRDLVDSLADGLASGDLQPVEALVEAELCIRALARGGLLSTLHAQAVPELSPDAAAAIHTDDTQIHEETTVRASVRRGLRMLDTTAGFPDRIPAVGSNLVEALSTARSIEDVAAVPGRIIDVRGQTMIPGEPAFGVSQHVAGLVLAARANGSDVRAAVNVRYDERFRDVLVDQGAVTAEFDAEIALEDAIAEALAETPDANVLYQTGGFGIEPVLYILGPDAPSVVKTLRTALQTANS